jgi:DNA-binding GntR family transcriptional regulator
VSGAREPRRQPLVQSAAVGEASADDVPSGLRRGERARPLAAPVLSPAPTGLLAEEVVDRIREPIFRGLLAPGDRLPEEQLAETLGVSRGPIRDALTQLEREGLVVRRRNRGAVVARLRRRDLDEVYSLRQAIESIACTWAARNADEQDHADLQAIIDGYAELSPTLTLQEAAEADLRFHDTIYAAARHRRLLRMWHELRPQVYLFLLARPYVRTPDFREFMSTRHALLLDAIRARDETEAEKVAVAHVETSYQRVISAYDEGSSEEE